MGNINNSEREYRARENKWVGNVRETEHGRLLSLGKELRVLEWEEHGGGGDWVVGTEGALDGMRAGCYSACCQIEHQYKINLFKNNKIKGKKQNVSGKFTFNSISICASIQP